LERLEERELLTGGYLLSGGNLYQSTTSGLVLMDTGVKSFSVFNSLVYDLHANGTVYQVNWGIQIGSGYSALVSNAQGAVYALNPANHDVYRYTGGSTWASTNTAHDIQSLVADGSGAIYELSFVNHGVWLYSGSSWTSVTSNDIASIAVDANGFLYALSFANHNIWFHNGGNSWVSTGTAGDIGSMAVDASGNLYALSFATHNVYVYGGSSNWLSTGTTGAIASMAVDGASGELFELNFLNHNVWLYAGGTSDYLISAGTAGDIASLGADAFGTLYALNFDNHNVWRYAENYSWASTNTAYDIGAMAVDGTGAVFELSFGNHGVWQYTGGASPSWVNVATNISGIAADGSGTLLALASTTGTPLVHLTGGGASWRGPASVTELVTDFSVLAAARPVADNPYSPVTGTLFGPNGLPTFLDITQGLDDCWLMAGLAAVAARPAGQTDIQGMFSYIANVWEDGHWVSLYTVRYYTNGVPNYVVVDTELPPGSSGYVTPVGGGTSPANGSPTPVLWPALAEKAYAEANAAGFVTTNNVGSDYYHALEFGSLAWSISAVTGQATTMNNPEPTVAMGAAYAWNNNAFVGLGTYMPLNPAIVAGHAYALVGYNPSPYCYRPFEIFNPWGADANDVWTPDHYGQIYGLVWVDGQFVNQNFISVGSSLTANLIASPGAVAPPLASPRPEALDALFAAAAGPGPGAASAPAGPSSSNAGQGLGDRWLMAGLAMPEARAPSDVQGLVTPVRTASAASQAADIDPLAGPGSVSGAPTPMPAEKASLVTTDFDDASTADDTSGIGGDVCTVGMFSFDASTVSADNHASTNDRGIVL
jgi:hypothetical protein